MPQAGCAEIEAKFIDLAERWQNNVGISEDNLGGSMELAAGDRVRIVGLVQSDCVGVTGTVLEVNPSTLFGPRHKRCRVDFKGRVRGILSCHLRKVEEKPVPQAVAS